MNNSVIYNKVAIVASAPLTLERPPAALAALAGICEHNQIEYEFFDINVCLRQQLTDEDYALMENHFTTDSIISEQTEKNIIDVFKFVINKILDYAPDLVAFTSFSALQNSCSKKFLRMFRERSNTPVIGGGPGIMYEQNPNKTMGKILAEQNLLDFYVLGEGDLVFDKFLKGVINLGVNYKLDKYENWAPQIDDLNCLIIPSYKKINFTHYQSLAENKKPVITINGSRGCVRRCTFCDIGNIWKKFRFKSAESLSKEIQKHFYDTGHTIFFFSDSLINGSLKQFKDLMVQLIELKSKNPDFKNVKYSGQFIIRPKQQHPEEIFKLMSLSGCDTIEVGIETGSDAVRFHMGKKFSNEDIDYHFQMSEKYKIKNTVLMFTAYPTETLKDHKDTLDFFTKNQKYLINDTILLTNISGPVLIYRNTPLDSMRHELGIEIHDVEYVSNWTSEKNPELTIKEKYRRYVELIQHTTNLRYSRSHIDLQLIEHNLNHLVKKNL